HARVRGLAGDVGELLPVGDGYHVVSSSMGERRPRWWDAGRSPVEPTGPRGVVVTGSPTLGRVTGVAVRARHALDVHDARPGLDDAGEQGEVLAAGVALEAARQVEVAQHRVADEVDAVHLVGLALVPVGAGVHLGP